MPQGGELIVTLDAKPGRDVTIAFSDTGGGMSREQKDRLFEPFNSSSGGTGWGWQSSISWCGTTTAKSCRQRKPVRGPESRLECRQQPRRGSTPEVPMSCPRGFNAAGSSSECLSEDEWERE